MTVLDTLEETGLTNDTIILRFADHGEGGLSHGMREKAYTVYEEMIHIPLIVHNPKLYPEPLETSALITSILLPTILDLAGVADASPTASAGASFRSCEIHRRRCRIIRSRTASSPASTPGGHIRAIREGDWTHAVYFASTAPDWNMSSTTSRAIPANTAQSARRPEPRCLKMEWARLHQILTDRLVASANLPDGLLWPRSNP